MQKTEDRISQKRHHISALASACRHRRPKTFMPFIARLAPNALRHQSIHHQSANLTLRHVVRRTDLRVATLLIFLHRLVDEQKVTLAMFFKTIRNHRRLFVIRNKSLNRLLNRLFVTVHQTLEADLRQLILPMNRCKHLFDVLQQTLAIRLRVVKRRQKLDLANQMCPTELKKRFRLLLVLQVGREKVAADAAEEILAERIMQHLAATRGVDLEKREKFRNETPSPLLRDFGRRVGEVEFMSAIGALGQFELDDFVDEFRCDGLAQVLLVTLLAAGLAFLTGAFALTVTFVFAFGLGGFRRLDDIDGGLEEFAEFFSRTAMRSVNSEMV